MLTYSIADRKNESIYEYLYNCIKNDIINGNLPPHTKLPSKRVFASNNGISIVTVESTYGQLMAEGYIYSIPKKGYFVADISNIDVSIGKNDNNIFFNRIADSSQCITSLYSSAYIKICSLVVA